MSQHGARPSAPNAAGVNAGNDAEEAQWLAEIEAESIGWLPLGEGAYLHVGKPVDRDVVITVVGVPEVGMVGMNMLLVGW